jgi:hypothetical protein
MSKLIGLDGAAAADDQPGVDPQYLENVYPVQAMDRLTNTLKVYQGITLLDYYLSTAPAPPEAWYDEHDTGDALETQIKWRYAYATNMILHRNIFFDTGKLPGHE